MDRYLWRTGHRWSGDSCPLHEIRGKFYLPWRIAAILFIPEIITGAFLLFRGI